MMNVNDIPITDTALYKMCREVYRQYTAHHIYNFNDDLARLQASVENYLRLSVQEIEGEVIVTFILQKGDIDG